MRRHPSMIHAATPVHFPCGDTLLSIHAVLTHLALDRLISAPRSPVSDRDGPDDNFGAAPRDGQASRHRIRIWIRLLFRSPAGSSRQRRGPCGARCPGDTAQKCSRGRWWRELVNALKGFGVDVHSDVQVWRREVWTCRCGDDNCWSDDVVLAPCPLPPPARHRPQAIDNCLWNDVNAGTGRAALDSCIRQRVAETVQASGIPAGVSACPRVLASSARRASQAQVMAPPPQFVVTPAVAQPAVTPAAGRWKSPLPRRTAASSHCSASFDPTVLHDIPSCWPWR